MLELLTGHSDAATFVATKLARRFISDSPPDELISRAAQTLLRSKGDLRSVLRVILLDGLAFAEPKYKRPVNFIASALRMLNAETDGSEAVQDYLLRMGQTAFGWPTPDGYPDRAEPWQGNLLPRWQFAFSLMRNEIPNAEVNLQDLLEISGARTLTESIDQIASLLLGSPLDPAARDELIQTVQAAGADEAETMDVVTAGLLASPAFQWR